MLGDGGFESARDIAGIAENRWPHGYSYTYNSLYDPLDLVFTSTGASILEAHRAVQEVFAMF